MKRTTLAALGFISAIGSAMASERPNTPHWYAKNAGNADVIIVWKSAAAHSKGIDYITHDMHHTHPELMYPLVACVAANGSEVIMDSVGLFSHDITVVNGQSAGCSGNVASNDITMIIK